MEQEMNYKDEIAATRKGCLGSSDGRIIAQVVALGCVPKSAYKRMAVVNGLIPQQEIPRTAAIKAGDDVEMMVYNNLKAQDPRYESNPLWVSKKYSKEHVKLISHPDIVLKDDARKTLFIYECKATKNSVEETRQTYMAQMYIHNIIGKEIVQGYGTGWTVKVSLVHYNTDGLDLSAGVEFDPSRLTIKEVSFSKNYIDMEAGMTIIDNFLATFTEYYEGDDVNADMLPTPVKSQFDNVAAMLIEIAEREKKVDEFKQRLYDFMLQHDIKNISNDVFTITRVDPSESKSFDAKRFVETFTKEHPRKAKKLIADYTKVTKRKGYATIKIKKQEQ